MSTRRKGPPVPCACGRAEVGEVEGLPGNGPGTPRPTLHHGADVCFTRGAAAVLVSEDDLWRSMGYGGAPVSVPKLPLSGGRKRARMPIK
jgi:hypothetical protein